MKCPICNIEIENSNEILQNHIQNNHSGNCNFKNILNIPIPNNKNAKNSFKDYVHVVD